MAAAALSLTALSACGTNAQPAEPRASNTVPAATATATPPNTAKASTPNAGNPCYVHLFDDDNFADENDIVYGPGKWSNLRGLPGATEVDWGGESDSLKVGPAATVKVWANENFQGDSQTFEPGTEMPKLAAEFRSMEITCKQ